MRRFLARAALVAALLVAVAPAARAESIIMTVSWSGGSLTFDSMTVSPFVLSASSTQLLVNTSAVASFMSGHGASAVLTDIGATSNFPGGIPDPREANLTVQGNAQLSGAGTATSISVITSESGFHTPSGTGGTLTSTQSTILSPTVIPILPDGENVHSTASGAGSFTAALMTHISDTIENSAPIGSIPSTYTIGSVVGINLAGSPSGSGSTIQFQELSVVTGAGIVAEPLGIVLLLTGLPLPLIVLGLARRRRPAA